MRRERRDRRCQQCSLSQLLDAECLRDTPPPPRPMNNGHLGQVLHVGLSRSESASNSLAHRRENCTPSQRKLGIRILQLLHQLGVGEQVAIEAGENAGIGVRTVAMCFARVYLSVCEHTYVHAVEESLQEAVSHLNTGGLETSGCGEPS